MSEFKINTIAEAIQAIQNGEIVIVADDEDRENEGDFICAAEKITPEIVNFMAKEGRGLICCAIPEERCEELGLELMVGRNTAAFETPFTVSVDLIGYGCTTGISASDRAKTIKALVNPDTKPYELGKPGHIFPLKSRKGGVLRRTGHTEAAVDLARLAGLEAGGVLVEIMNDDGSMARMPDLVKVAEKHNLKLITIKDLVEYRVQHDSLIKQEFEWEDMPSSWGNFKMIAFRQTNTDDIHLALVKGQWEKDEAVLVRVHSSSITADIFGSHRGTGESQLHKAMELVQKEGKGVVLYMNQEGKGFGLINKLKAYKLQEQGLDTAEANLELGLKMDARDYGVGAQILRELDITKLRLISNNPKKRVGLIGYGLKIVENVSIEISSKPYDEKYLQTKRDKIEHHNLKNK